jgi:hypothetical protein
MIGIRQVAPIIQLHFRLCQFHNGFHYYDVQYVGILVRVRTMSLVWKGRHNCRGKCKFEALDVRPKLERESKDEALKEVM